LHFPAKPKSSNLLAMSDIPPKRTPETPCEAPESGSGLVAMYNAASHANAESFPVLKAFQDYIEAERAQARKRVMQLSVFFAVLMGVVVTGFLTAGMFMLRNMSDVQTKLLDVALAAKETHVPQPQPVVVSAPVAPPAPSPLFEASVREISQATTELRASLDKKLNGVSDIAAKVHDRVAAQESELEKLRGELKNIQAQNARLNRERDTSKSVSLPVPDRPQPAHVAAATPAAPAARTKPAAVPAEKAGHAAVPATGVPQAASLPKPPAAVQQPVPPQPATADTVAPLPHPVKATAAPQFPPAVKDPPVPADGVIPPPAPAGRLATAIPLKTKNTGTIPWRVLIPD